MATVSMNALQGPFSGMIGKELVFRTVGNQMIVQAAPVRKTTSTRAQQKAQKRFREGAQYAKRKLADPIAKEAYTLAIKGNSKRTAYHVALTDFLNPPQIKRIDCSGYSGHAGDQIRVYATDDFRVTEVRVKIVTADGIQLESGNATLQPNGLEWVYMVTVANAVPTGTRIVSTACDLPGNQTVAEEVHG